jgi:hemolysin III
LTSEAYTPARPLLRGVSHQWAFFASLVAGGLLIAGADGPAAYVSAAVFASSVAAMFGASALYHRITWSSQQARLLMRRVDHAGVYGLIAGTYTPFGLLVLHGPWRIAMLATVWTGTAAAAGLKVVWVDAPKWLAAASGIALGWIGIVAAPQLVRALGPSGTVLLIGGGIAYTAGAIVYARRRPNPMPTVFGYHEVFHVLVIVAVALQYAAVAFWVVH